MNIFDYKIKYIYNIKLKYNYVINLHNYKHFTDYVGYPPEYFFKMKNSITKMESILNEHLIIDYFINYEGLYYSYNITNNYFDSFSICTNIKIPDNIINICNKQCKITIKYLYETNLIIDLFDFHRQIYKYKQFNQNNITKIKKNLLYFIYHNNTEDINQINQIIQNNNKKIDILPDEILTKIIKYIIPILTIYTKCNELLDNIKLNKTFSIFPEFIKLKTTSDNIYQITRLGCERLEYDYFQLTRSSFIDDDYFDYNYADYDEDYIKLFSKVTIL